MPTAVLYGGMHMLAVLAILAQTHASVRRDAHVSAVLAILGQIHASVQKNARVSCTGHTCTDTCLSMKKCTYVSRLAILAQTHASL